MKKILITIMAVIMMISTAGCTVGGDDTPQRVDDTRSLDAFEYSLMNLAGTDGIGRRVETADAKKSGTKEVGLFYSVWLGQHPERQTGIYDITALLMTQEGRDAVADLTSNELSRVEEFHFSDEPLYGYYNMSDPWVLTRHVEILTMAGIDYLCIDATNFIIYPAPTNALLGTLLKYQKQGWNVPKVMFYTNSYSGTTVKKVYNEFYQTEKYNSLWRMNNGKPMIMGITEDNRNASDQTKYQSNYTDFVTADMKEFFDVWESQWPNGDLNFEKGIPWMSWQYPQKIHTGSKSISVSVAQHSPTRIQMSFMDPQSSRGYDYLSETVEGNYWEGRNFHNEWQTVFDNESDIENVMVTSFNEWMAIKTISGGRSNFCDVYNEEYSRDLEMGKGKNKDYFLMQLFENVRKFKYTEGAAKYKWQQFSVDIHSSSSLVIWEHVKAKYADFEGDAMARNFNNAVGSFKYTDNSNRNDIVDIRVTHDKTNLYFYVRTADDITEHNGTDVNWMNILIDTTFNGSGFEGYNYIIGRKPKADGTTSVEKSKGGYDWLDSGAGSFKLYGDVMVASVPLSTLGLTPDNCRIEFKVADNVTHYDDIMDYYVTGDSAPIGRLNYSYGK